MMREMRGVCFLFSETGTEGGWWAMQEDGFEDEEGSWSYDGLRQLQEGDDFTVYAGDGSVLFHGIIHRDTETGAIPRQIIRDEQLLNDQIWRQQVSRGMWVHWTQKGMAPDVWSELFVGEKRCLLRREVGDPTGALLDRLRHQPAMNAGCWSKEELYERQHDISENKPKHGRRVNK